MKPKLTEKGLEPPKYDGWPKDPSPQQDRQDRGPRITGGASFTENLTFLANKVIRLPRGGKIQAIDPESALNRGGTATALTHIRRRGKR